MFNNRNISASLAKDAERCLLAKGAAGNLFEHLHSDPFDIQVLPLVKNGAKKIAHGFSWHTSGTDARFLLRLWFNQGQKTYGLGSHIFKKPVNLKRVVNIFFVDDTEDIAGNAMLL